MGRLFVFVDEARRQRCLAAVAAAPLGWEVLLSPPRMTDGQSKRFHAICRDFERSGLEWAGAQRTAAEWKVLLISGHAQATGEQGEVIEGLEGELVAIRESTTSMERARGASLIEYAQAAADMLGVRLSYRKD